MYRQYHSIHTSSPQHQSFQFDSSHLDERIKKIKRKYGNQSQKFSNNRQYIQSKLNYSVCEQLDFPNASKLAKCNGKLAKSIIEGDFNNVDKENSMMGLNCSIIQQNEIVEKRANRRVKYNQRIQQLEQINDKIGKLIQCLKVDQIQNQVLKINGQSACSTQTIKQQSLSTLEATKISEKNAKNMKIQPAIRTSLYDKSHLRLKYPSQNDYQPLRNYKSVESHKSSSRIGKMQVKNEREAGKLSRIKNATKSYKILRNNEEVLLQSSLNQRQRNLLIKELCKQIILDSQFMKHKTRLIRNGLNAKQLLESAIETGNWTEEEKQIMLQWNFEDIDPLFTQRCYNTGKIQNTNQMVYETIDCFLKCQDNWKRRIYKKFSSDKINLHDLDGEKGYFIKQDLARFLSIQNKSMYCNRDINIIFRRLNTKKNKIVPMKDLFNIICS